jgi:Ca2+/Na+ antiporter
LQHAPFAGGAEIFLLAASPPRRFILVHGNIEEVEVEVWNGTVANLTLMALGSSAPEILLAAVETCALTFQAGDLGPGTIVGSAAFNLLFVVHHSHLYLMPARR